MVEGAPIKSATTQGKGFHASQEYQADRAKTT